MKTFPAAYLSHILQGCTSLAVCWRVIRRDGVEILGTELDRDIEITTGDFAGAYIARAGITGSDVRSTSDMSVENMEASGVLQAQDLVLDLNAADLEAGLFDDADVTTFVCNYEDPDSHQDIIRTGYIGSITRTAEGAYRAEVRGLTQALSQGIVRTYGVGCDAELFDARCKVPTGLWTFGGAITAIISPRREWTVFLPLAPPADTLVGGTILFLTGANEGYRKEIREHDATPNIRVFDRLPYDVQVGDTFTAFAGCRKRLIEDCKDKFGNIENFRGHGVFVPGETALLRVGRK